MRGGVPVYWVDSQRAREGGLIVRTGRSDETLALSGISHLVEHLALPARTHEHVEFNGMADGTNTIFWAEGEPAAVERFLHETALALTALPIDRLELERSILETESSNWSAGQAGLLAALRFGASGHGIVGHDETGLLGLTEDRVLDWAASRYTRGNAAIYLGWPPVGELDLPLASGARLPPADPAPIDYVRFPSALEGGFDDTVAFSLVVERTAAANTGMIVLEDRLREHLRYRAGMSYAVQSTYEPLTAEHAHFVVWADAVGANLERVRSTMVAVLDDLADAGSRSDELQAEIDALAERDSDPERVIGRLFRATSRELIGMGPQDDLEYAAELRAVTPEDVAATVRRAAESILLMVPDDVPIPRGRFTEYPMRSPTRASGRRHRPRALRSRLRPKEWLLVDEIALTYESGNVLATVPFDDCVALIRWADGSRTAWSRDGFRVYFDPADWVGGAEIVDQLDRSVDSAAIVDPLGAQDVDEAFRRADEFLEADRWREALEAAEEGLTREPDSAVGLFLLGTAHMALQHTSDALATARRAVEADPNNERVRLLLGNTLLQAGYVQEAADEAAATLGLDPGGVDTLVECAWILGRAGRVDEAERAAARALEHYPEEPWAWNAHANVLESRAEWAAAEVDLRRAVELGPDEFMLLNNLGWNLLQQERAGEALELFESSRRKAPGNSYPEFNRAIALGLLGRREEALRAMEDANAAALQRAEDGLRREENVDSLRLYAFAAWYAGRDEDSLAHARQAAALEAHAIARAELARVLANTGRLDEARQQVEEASAAFPDNLEVHRVAAWLGAVIGDAGMAQRGAERVGALTVDGRAIERASGYAAAARGDWASAREAFEGRLRIDPLNCCANTWSGIARLQAGDRTTAEQRLETATWVSCGCRCPAFRRLEHELAERSDG